MNVARIAGFLVVGFLAQEVQAQNPWPAMGDPHGDPLVRPSPLPSGRLGIMTGMAYQKGTAYGAQLSGLYYLTPENRPLSFRAQAYAAWSPFQTTFAKAPDSGTLVSSGSSTQVGGAIAALLHARPKSQVSPYLIASYGRSLRWQNGTHQVFDARDLAIEPSNPWVHSYSWGEFGVGGGIRAQAAGQTFRLEVTSTNNRTALSLGMNLPL